MAGSQTWQLLSSALFAFVSFTTITIAALAEVDLGAAVHAFCGFKIRRVGKLLKIILICSSINVQLRRKCLTTVSAIFPVAGMPFIEMVAAQGISLMIPVATIACVREEYILAFVVAYQVSTACSSGQFLGLTTQTAAWLIRRQSRSWPGQNLFVGTTRLGGPAVCFHSLLFGRRSITSNIFNSFELLEP
jgi:hypothetical protein